MTPGRLAGSKATLLDLVEFGISERMRLIAMGLRNGSLAKVQPPWDHGYIDWPDFGVPASTEAVVEALKTVLERARSGQNVEVGCLGGHGRTGTALACLAVLAGHPALDAVAWTRSNYCARAVETPEQEAFIAALGNS